MHNRNEGRPQGGPQRTEPVLGNLDQLDAGADRRGAAREPAPRVPPVLPTFAVGERRTRPARQRRRVPWWIAAVAVVLAGGGAWAWNHQALLSSLLPQTQLNSLLTRADQAYAAGKLADGPNSARGLYEAAHALDPDNNQALTGLQNVGNAELARAKAALQQRDYTTARVALEEARSLLGGGAGVDAVDQSLAKAVLHSANVDVLVGQARAALSNGRIDGNDGAAALFRKVLAGDPTNAVAQHGMNQVGDVLAARIQQELGNHDRAGAQQTLNHLAGLVPRYSALPSLRAAIATADRAADAQRDQYLAQGQAYLRAGKVVGGGNANAEAQFKAALAADPGNAQAEAGLGQVAGALIVQANAAIDAGQPKVAGKLLDQATALAPKSADLAAARSRLQGHGSAAEAAASAPTSAPLTPADSAKLARLVARAKRAAGQGNIMLPPGNSAYDLYRAALGIDGNNAAAQAGIRALPAASRQRFDLDLQKDDLDGAHDMLATLEQLNPGDPTIAMLRRKLGRAWLDRAEHYIGLGETGAARAALREARRLVPGDPRVSEVDAKLERNG